MDINRNYVEVQLLLRNLIERDTIKKEKRQPQKSCLLNHKKAIIVH